MLFIIVGIDGEIKEKSKEYFESKGFNFIKKKSYSPEDLKWNTRDPKDNVNKENIQKCDFTYQNHGRTLGFDKNDIFLAVGGKKDSVLTISSEDLTLVSEIKAAYSYSVTVIYVYVENRSLEQTISKFENITNEEKQKRLNLGYKIKEVYKKNIDLFDEVVIFDNQKKGFGYKSLFTQYDNIIKNASKRQIIPVPMPYTGNDKYVFISYSHKNNRKVLNILKDLQKEGYRIWFDQGIKGGDNWRNILLEKIKDCTEFIVFVSKQSVVSEYVKEEVKLAINTKERVIPITFDNSKFGENEIDDILFDKKQFIKYNPSTIIQKLKDCLDKSVCIKLGE